MKADVLPEGVDVLLPLLQIVLHPGYQSLAHVSLTEAEREVRNFFLVAF